MVTRETSLFQGLAEMGLAPSDEEIRRLAKLADLLENDAVDLGFLGPNEGQRVVSRHLLEAAALIPLIDDGPVVDVGSGAGLPGLVLAAFGADVVLIDAQAKRADFLRRASSEIGVAAEVRHARAEDEGHADLREAAGAVVARALAAPATALELCLPFARPGGRFLLLASPEEDSVPPDVSDGDPTDRGDAALSVGRAEARADVELASVDDLTAGTGLRDAYAPVRRDLRAAARLLGGADPRWMPLSVPGADGPRWVMMVDKRAPTPDRFPRRPGVPKRRPLGGDVASVD